MFGQNPIRPIEHLDGKDLRVQEIFYTIQGEGPFSGTPSIFIRLAGCNLRCHFCDTEFESNYDNRLSLAHIIKSHDFEGEFVAKRSELVVLTGGEPLIQNVIPLLDSLFALGTKVVQIETAGTVWMPGLERLIMAGKVVLVCSPKTPKVHPKVAELCKHWKYIVTQGEQDPHDGLPCISTQMPGHSARIYRADPLSQGTIWVSPCDAHEAVKSYMNMLAARDAALKHGYRLSLQIHKLIDVR